MRDYELHSRFGDLPFLHAAAVAALDAVGLGALARAFDDWGAVQAVERLNLDGLLALWHPPARISGALKAFDTHGAGGRGRRAT